MNDEHRSLSSRAVIGTTGAKCLTCDAKALLRNIKPCATLTQGDEDAKNPCCMKKKQLPHHPNHHPRACKTKWLGSEVTAGKNKAGHKHKHMP